MKLGLDMVQLAPQFIAPTKDRTIVFRGLRISAIENLGATLDHYDCIDLSDNEIIRLENIPYFKRLATLILCNNRISRIAPDCLKELSSLRSIVLTNNKLERLADLAPIFDCRRLERLCLVENPVTNVDKYRLVVIYSTPSLRYLDFERVTQKQRAAARSLFSTEDGKKLLEKMLAPRTSATGVAVIPRGAKCAEPSANIDSETVERIKLAISQAATIDEVLRLEKALKSGIMPEKLLPKLSTVSGEGPNKDKENDMMEIVSETDIINTGANKTNIDTLNPCAENGLKSLPQETDDDQFSDVMEATE